MTYTFLEIKRLSFIEFTSDIFLTPLVSKPKLVNALTNSIVEFKRLKIPYPAKPIKMAKNFDLIIDTIIEETCTPPNIVVALRIFRYVFFFSITH
jgi:hypothetical protein